MTSFYKQKHIQFVENVQRTETFKELIDFLDCIAVKLDWNDEFFIIQPDKMEEFVKNSEALLQLYNSLDKNTDEFTRLEETIHIVANDVLWLEFEANSDTKKQSAAYKLTVLSNLLNN